MRRYLFVLLALLLISACGEIPTLNDGKLVRNKTTIVNGTIPEPSQQDAVTKSTVALTTLEQMKKGMSFCTGTIIDRNVVMTAAHCASEANAKKYIVAFGRTVEEAVKKKSFINVVKAEVHDGYFSAEYGNDIALLLLKDDIPEGYEPAPISIEDLDTDSNFLVAGFGVTKFGNSQHDTGILRQADVKFLKIYDELQIVLIGENGEDTCQGDSGGPAYVTIGNKMYVAGITSWGHGCGIRGFYTHVKLFSDWIIETIEGFNNPI